MSEGKSSDRTVRVRIAVGVSPSGRYCASGWNGGENAEDGPLTCIDVFEENGDLADGVRAYWVTAELPIPLADVPEFEGSVMTDLKSVTRRGDEAEQRLRAKFPPT